MYQDLRAIGYRTASVLSNGNVLVVGGVGVGSFNTPTRTEVYDASTGTWIMSGSLNNVRSGHTASVLSNGKVFVAGGFNNSELYDPSTGVWTVSGIMSTHRSVTTASTLPNGRILLAG